MHLDRQSREAGRPHTRVAQVIASPFLLSRSNGDKWLAADLSPKRPAVSMKVLIESHIGGCGNPSFRRRPLSNHWLEGKGFLSECQASPAESNTTARAMAISLDRFFPPSFYTFDP